MTYIINYAKIVKLSERSILFSDFSFALSIIIFIFAVVNIL